MKNVPDKNANGNWFTLNADTCLKKFDIGRGVKEEWHREAETGEIVILNSWYVMDGDSVTPEFEVMEVIPKGGLIQELKDLIGQE